MAREIPLTKGFVALVDEADFAWASQRKWHAINNRRGHVYAARKSRGSTIYLHREIAATPKGLHTDHINGNTLDCTRGNLRVCEARENMRNRRRGRDGADAYKGVARQGARWIAQIGIDCTRKYLGSFDTSEQAARAYDAAALRLHGEFARLNFPDSRPVEHSCKSLWLPSLASSQHDKRQGEGC
jgi:hypothetical protein